MSNFTRFKKLFHQIQVIRPPKHRLSTFGSSTINYTLVTDVSGLPDRARLRIGQVTAEKPIIITPQTFKERFSGFGAEAEDYANALLAQYGDALKGLEYQFKNEPISSRVELSAPDHLVNDLIKDFDQKDEYQKVLIRGTDKLWEVSVMKFIVEEILSSFSQNLQELHERGFFDGDRENSRKHREIQYLLQKSKLERRLIPELGKKLKEYELFEQYQDEFFKLISP